MSNSNVMEKLLVDTGVVQLPFEPHIITPKEEYPHSWLIPHFNWVSPVDYFNGTLHQYVEIIERPTEKSFGLKLILDETANTVPCSSDIKEFKTKVQGHHWNMSAEITCTGVYTMSRPFRSLRDGTNLFNTDKMSNPPCFRFWIANQTAPGVNIPFDNKDYFPYKIRVIWVICAANHDFSGWKSYI